MYKPRFSAIFGATLLTLSYATVASAHVVRRVGADVGLSVYSDDNFRGRSATFRGDVPNMAPYGLNDRISSLRVGRNEVWEVCDASYYRGRCATVRGWESNLGRSGLEDRISSARRISRDRGY